MIGRTLSHYTVVDELGRGGMGVVYRAIDVTLDREVALKVLLPEFVADPDRRRRFVQEAKAAAALEHPSIGVVHEVGDADGVIFIAMELIRGERLRELLQRGSVPIGRAVSLALEAAEGLAKAHDKGIVHRDLTPANVIVSDDGHAKVIDFGLAKLLEPVSGADSDAETRARTEAGMVMGTTAYMSPEQARGQTADHRSDVFSLGVLLHEMLSGASLFKRASGAETLNAVIHSPDPPVTLPVTSDASSELRRIVHKCLAKDPRDRYQTMRDLVVDLREVGRRLDAVSGPQVVTAARPTYGKRWTPVALAALIVAIIAGSVWFRTRGGSTALAGTSPTRVAVLPFANLGAPDDEYFAAGMTEEVMSRLAAVSRLAVISRNSVLPYAKTAKTSKQIGEELNVDYLVLGTVRWQPAQDGPGRVRVTPQLIRVADDTQVWSDTYERRFDEVFALQSDIAGRVIQELNITLQALERTLIAGGPMPAFEAYREYLRGHFLYYSAATRSLAEVRQQRNEALKHFERTVALDPGFAAGHAAVATASAYVFFYQEPTSVWEAKAEAAIEKALSLNPNLAEAYRARGDLLWTQPRGFPHERALQEYRKALTLNPNLAEGRVAMARLYEHVGLLDEARDELQQALALDPTNREAPGRIVLTYLWQHDAARALSQLERNAGGLNQWSAVEALVYLNRDEEARTLAEKLRAVPQPVEVGIYAVLLARNGEGERADALLPKLEATARNPEGFSHVHHAQHAVGLVHALRGRKREAVTWLRKAAAEGFPCYPFFAKDPNLASLSGDPEFETFMAELKTQWERLKAEARSSKR